MKKVATSQFHDYYEAQLQMHLICLRYFFEFMDMHGEKVYYGNYEFDKECITNRDRMFDCPQNLREEENFLHFRIYWKRVKNQNIWTGILSTNCRLRGNGERSQTSNASATTVECQS